MDIADARKEAKRRNKEGIPAPGGKKFWTAKAVMNQDDVPDQRPSVEPAAGVTTMDYEKHRQQNGKSPVARFFLKEEVEAWKAGGKVETLIGAEMIHTERMVESGRLTEDGYEEHIRTILDFVREALQA